MTTTGNNDSNINLALPNTPPARSQSTTIEQTRAIAEVMAAVRVAREFPRDAAAAIRKMEEACASPQVAERAFFRFSRVRGEAPITGPSIHLARTLAACWGNVQYGIAELSRDEQAGESEMQAWAWDLETNTRASTAFIVPHRRDTRDGIKALGDLRSVYENNANQGARRVREMVWGVLPVSFVERAVQVCRKTIEDGGGVPLAQRVANLIGGYDALGISTRQLEERVGRPTSKWTGYDLAELQVIGQSIQRGEVRAEDEFTSERVTAADLTGGPVKAYKTAGAPKDEAPAPDAPADEAGPSEPDGGVANDTPPPDTVQAARTALAAKAKQLNLTMPKVQVAYTARRGVAIRLETDPQRIREFTAELERDPTGTMRPADPASTQDGDET